MMQRGDKSLTVATIRVGRVGGILPRQKTAPVLAYTSAVPVVPVSVCILRMTVPDVPAPTKWKSPGLIPDEWPSPKPYLDPLAATFCWRAREPDPA